MAKKEHSFLLNLAIELSQDVYLSLPFTIIMEIITNCQLWAVVLDSGFSSDGSNSSSISQMLKDILLIPSVFNTVDIKYSATLVQISWIIFAAYLSLYSGTLLLVAARAFKGLESSHLSRFMTVWSFIHSRVIFFPINYLFCKIIRGNYVDKEGSHSSFSSNSLVFIFSVAFSLINFTLAFLKEFFFFRINKGKNTYLTKNNLQAQLYLLCKSINLFISCFPNVQTIAWVSSITTFLFNLLTLRIFYKRLPYFNITLMKCSYLLTSFGLSLCFFAILCNLASNTRKIQSFFLLCSIFFIKFLYTKLIKLFERILCGQFSTPEIAMHFLILLKKYPKMYDSLITARKRFPTESIFFYSYFTTGLDSEKTTEDSKIGKMIDATFYVNFLELCASLKINYRKSEAFLLFIVQAIAKKSNNTFQALHLLEEVSKLSSSIPAKASISNLHQKLKGEYGKILSDSSDASELRSYFICRDQLTLLKQQMQKELLLHLDFWKLLTTEKVNMKTVTTISNEIHKVNKVIKRLWERNSRDFSRTHLSSFLLYGLYLDLIRSTPQESSQAVHKYFSLSKNIHFKKKEDLISSHCALIVTSLEKEKIGQVVDSSDSVYSIFGIRRSEFIGSKINLMMPEFISRVHDKFMQRYILGTLRYGMNKTIYSYGKTLDGGFVDLSLRLKIFPFLDRGVNLVAHVKQNSPEKPVIMVNHEGAIVEASRNLLKLLKISSKKTYMNKICPKFDKINSAFNKHYLKNLNEKEDNKPSKVDNQQGKDVIGSYLSKDSLLSLNHSQPRNAPVKSAFLKFRNSIDSNSQTQEKSAKDEEAHLMSLSQPMSPTATMLSPTTIPTPKKGSIFSPKNTNLPALLGGEAPNLSRFAADLINKKEPSGSYITINEEEAQRICEKFEAGSTLEIFSCDSNPNASKGGVTLKVVVSPYHFEGGAYKIIKIVDLHSTMENREKELKSKLTPSFLEKESSTLEKESSEHSSTVLSKSESDEEVPQERKENEQTAKSKIPPSKPHQQQQQRSKALYSGFQELLEEKFSSQASFVIQQTQAKAQPIEIRASAQGSSVATFSNMDMKLIKRLTDLFENKKMRPLTMVSITIVYLMMLLIVVLLVFNFQMTQNSMTTSEGGVDILNTLSNRLATNIVAWEWLLMFYTRLLGLRPLFSVYGFSRSVIYNTTLKTEAYNANATLQMEGLENQEISDMLLSKVITLYDQNSQPLLGDEKVNIFTATNMLILPNYFIGKYKGLDSVLVKRPEFITLSNNTVNDYLITSENCIKGIYNVLQNILNKSINFSHIILVVENFALLALIISLCFVGKVIIDTYLSTFNALVKISDQSVLERVKSIKTFEALLGEDIEGNSYPKKFDQYLEGKGEKIIKVKDPKQMKQSGGGGGLFKRKVMSSNMVFDILKFNLPSIVFILAISGLFVVLWIGSNNSFSSINQMIGQLYVLNKVSYLNPLLVANFYFCVIYQNSTGMYIRNQDPFVQLTENLQSFETVNDQLLKAFAGQGSQGMDPVIKQILQSNVCPYLSASISSNCYIASQNGTLGLLGINSYSQTVSRSYISLYLSKPTTANAQTLLVPYYDIGVSFDFTLNGIYNYLIAYTLQKFHSEVEDMRSRNILLSLGAFAFIILSTLAIQAISIRRFIRLDNDQKKLFQVVTYRVISQNKILGFLLKKQFKGETEGLGKVLAV